MRGEQSFVTLSSVSLTSNTPAAFITLRDGVRMAFSDAGQGPTLLLVHGWAVNRDFFAELASRLQNEFRVIVPDLRGHGLTPPGDGPLSIERLAGDVAELIDTLDLQNAVALGWSMGASVLWNMIEARGPDGLAGLIIEDMSPRVLNDANWSLGMQRGLDAEMNRELEADIRADWWAFASAFSRRMFARDYVITDQLAELLEQMRGNDSEAMAALWASMTDADFRPGLSGLSIPTCVMHGACSQSYSPATSRFLVDTIPHAERISFARSGHAPHLEEPEAFAIAVAGFAHRTQSDAEADQLVNRGNTP